MAERNRRRLEWLAVAALLIALPSFFALVSWAKHGYLELSSADAVRSGLAIGAVADTLLLAVVGAVWWRDRAEREQT